ncbi:hypothetical protein DL93DRAFT_2088237 [Clavulina sp. PMI_390]|nr:hypothetical protein DL93DRAFT_2088237 [Clavulina sp. PMI_390]
MAKFIDVEAEIPVTNVQLDGLVVTKIIKHARESTSSANGVLLGIDLDGTLEVSNSFALPPSSTDEEQKAASSRYELSMLRVLKEAQYDDSLVGFYLSTALGAFMRQSWLTVQAARYESLRQGGIVLVHDASHSHHANPSIRAFRLTKAFLEAYKANKFNSQSLLDNQLTFATILEELPLTIRTSPLLSAYLETLSSPSSSSSSSLSPSYTHLDGLPQAHLTRAMDSLLDTMETYRTEENNVGFQARQIARERARAEAYVQKRKDENAMRVAQGLTPLPEEDVTRLFKIPADPSRLDTTLLLGQMDTYATNMETGSAAAMVSMYASLA